MFEVPVSLFVTLMTGVMVILAPLRIFVFLIKPIAMLVRLAAAFMIWFAHILSSLPFASIPTSYGFVAILLIFVLVLSIVYFLFRGRGASLKVCAAFLCIAVSVGLLSYTVSANGVVSIAALPTESGSCSVVISRGHAAIIDLGGSDSDYQAELYLKSKGIRKADILILPEYGESRLNNVTSLMDEVKINSVYMPGASKSNENTFAQGITQYGYISWQGVTFEILPDITDKHLMVIMKYMGSSALFTGGTDGDTGQYSIDSSAFKADAVLFSGDMEKDFAKAVSPQIAIEGSSNASYGGALYESLDSRVYDTQQTGRVTLLTRGGAYMVTTT